MAGNPNFDTLLSTTLANYRKTLEDNIFTARPLVYWLKRKDKIRTISGGAKIVVPLIYALNSTAGSYAGYDSLDTTPQDGISAAEYPWGQFAASVAISGLEEAQNNGEEEIIDLLEAKIMQTEETIAEKMDEMFFLDGSGNSNKDWWGLAAVVEASNPSRGNYGNIDRSTDTWWRSYEENTAASLTDAQMRTAYNTVSRGNDHPDYILTTQTLYETYEGLLVPNARYTDMKSADAGFQNLLFKDAPVFYDDYCQSGVMYFLNSKYLKLVGHKDKWFVNTEFRRPPDQDARYAQILAYGQLTCSNCKRQGKLTAKTA
jgi:hypothetical protein